MKFILNRTDDYLTHSRKWILGYGMLFWITTRLIAAAILIGCVAIYKSNGLDPESMTQFGGSPGRAVGMGRMWFVVSTIAFMAPLLEECIFRLGLSFKRWQIALGIAAIPLYMLWQLIPHFVVGKAVIYLLCAVGVFCLIRFGSSEKFWQEKKAYELRPTVWASAIAFGLIHLIAFTHYSPVLIPYMLCVILIPFFAGCAATYYRVNLGFWWGVGIHIFNNLPGLAIILS